PEPAGVTNTAMRPRLSAARPASADSTSTSSSFEAASTDIAAAAPGPASTPTRDFCGPWLRNAMPSANAMSTGNANTQNTASGSRKNTTMRVRVNWNSAESFRLRRSLIAQGPARQVHEHVLERRVVSRQAGERQAPALELGKQPWNRHMR